LTLSHAGFFFFAFFHVATGFSASKYSLIAGFDATSNVQAGKLLGVPIVGTHAHAYVQAHIDLNDAKDVSLAPAKGGEPQLLLPIVLKYRKELGPNWANTNNGELAAFLNYAAAFPDACLCLVDTYDTLQSGVRNFILVSLALDDLGYTPKGIRLDSGDLSYLSLESARMFREAAGKFDRPFFRKLSIAASNDINEEVLTALNKQGHAINLFGIGTNLVTCQQQPALGGVYKLVEINGTPRMKVSQTIEKVLIPGRKKSYRLYGVQGWPLLDIMICEGEEPPKAGERILCRHPFDEKKRAAVIPKRVAQLHDLVFDGKNGIVGGMCSIKESREVSSLFFEHRSIDFLLAAC
jgi:nicotinate phosphoribosyltransferase